VQLELVIYRIAYELVNNAMKHSGALSILVQIVRDPDRVSPTVQVGWHKYQNKCIKTAILLKLYYLCGVNFKHRKHETEINIGGNIRD
jgi:signal transduction histidine kinase